MFLRPEDLELTGTQVIHLCTCIGSFPMDPQMNNKILTASIILSLSLLIGTPAVNAQGNGTPQVSVVNLQVVPGPGGTQEVVTPKGDLAPLPGAGVNGSVVQIYIGAQGGYWYQDRTGQTVDLTPSVQALQQSRRAGANVQVPQYAPQEYQQQPQSSSSSSSSSSGGSSALGTAAAAAGGAMLGSAMTNSMYHYNMPYGTPMYYGAGGNPYYYGNNGEPRELNQNQQVAIYNQAKINNQQQDAAIAQTQSNQEARQQSSSQNQAARQQTYSSANASLIIKNTSSGISSNCNKIHKSGTRTQPILS